MRKFPHLVCKPPQFTTPVIVEVHPPLTGELLAIHFIDETGFHSAIGESQYKKLAAQLRERIDDLRKESSSKNL